MVDPGCVKDELALAELEIVEDPTFEWEDLRRFDDFGGGGGLINRIIFGITSISLLSTGTVLISWLIAQVNYFYWRSCNLVLLTFHDDTTGGGGAKILPLFSLTIHCYWDNCTQRKRLWS